MGRRRRLRLRVPRQPPRSHFEWDRLNFWTPPLRGCTHTVKCFYCVLRPSTVFSFGFPGLVPVKPSPCLSFVCSRALPFVIQARCPVASVRSPNVLLTVLKCSMGFVVLLVHVKYLQKPKKCVPMYCICTHKSASKCLSILSSLYGERPR